MRKSVWKTSKIYKELEKREGGVAEKIRNILGSAKVMDAIEAILSIGGSTPKDFTLHDSEHSFRVAEKMWEIIPQETKAILSNHELMFLLMSAYLHDIGMSPSFDKVERHLKFITDNECQDSLSSDEINDLQRWVDNDGGIKSFDVIEEKLSDSEIIKYVMSYYTRHKHNDWSGDWIRENILNIEIENYPDWVGDLIKLCKSHHYGLTDLKKDDYNPKPVGESIIHLRYLAMCLRVADVMENDPERTPLVVLQHRNISAQSLKYWEKDHYFQLRREGDKFSVYARPSRAYIHKAIGRWSNLG